MRVTVDRVHALAVGCLVLVLTGSLPIADPDLGWHLAAGALVWRTGHAPTADPFSYMSAGHAWVAYSWLAEAVFWAVADTAGFRALVVLCAGVVAATFVVVYRTCRDCDAHPLIAYGATLLAALASWLYTSQRPAMASFLLAAIFLRRLLRVRRDPATRLWPLVPLMVVWANVHVFFVFGLGWLGLAALFAGRGPAARRLWLATAAVAAATLLTPYGLGLWEHVLAIGGQPATVPEIVEHTSPDFHEAAGFLALPLIACLMAALATARRRPDPFLLVLTVGELCLALFMRRNVPLFAIAAAPLLAATATDALRGLRLPVPSPGPALGAVGGLFLLATLVWLPGPPGLEANARPDAYPTAAARFLADRPPLGRLYNSFNWGGYLIHTLYPRYRVAMDGRSTLYGVEDTQAYFRIHFARAGWEERLEAIHPDVVLWEREGALATALEGSPRWTRVYADDVAAVFVRADHPERPLLLAAAGGEP